MTEINEIEEFMSELESVKDNYDWYLRDGAIRGKNKSNKKGMQFRPCPIHAVQDKYLKEIQVEFNNGIYPFYTHTKEVGYCLVKTIIDSADNFIANDSFDERLRGRLLKMLKIGVAA